MKLNLSGWYCGIFKFDDKVLDLSVPEIRKELTQSYLEECYDNCIERIETLKDYFEDESAFKEALERIATTERAEIIAREPRYPPLWSSYPRKRIEKIINADITYEDVKYFYVPHYIFGEKIWRIEIPNYMLEKEAKADVYHETLHHFLRGYQKQANLSLIRKRGKVEEERWRIEFFLNEGMVELFTDLCLADDEEALFEYRWVRYYLGHPMHFVINFTTALATGATIGYSILHPKLFPVALALYAINNRLHWLYKKSKRHELLQPREKPKFKI